MDVLFIDPPWVVENDENLWSKVRSCLPSLGIAGIASYLEKHGFTVSIIDCTAERIALNGFPERLKALRKDPPRFVGITATSALIENAVTLARMAKTAFPESKVILGGVHPTVEPDATLSFPWVDCVVRGEGEVTTLELVSGRPWAEIPGLSYRRHEGIIHNVDRPLLGDLNELPPPAYHLLPMDKYFPAVGSYKRLPAMSIFATRGCPGRCTFCFQNFGGKVRKRSAESIIEEVRLLRNVYGIREIAFYDDTFTVFRDEVLRFCQILIKENIDLTWSCFSRVDCVDRELLQMMKSAGCHLILFGVESSDPVILATIRKKISLDQAITAVRVAREVGIATRASFMFGNPGETEETIKRTIDFAIRLDPDQAQFNITTVYPGTVMYEWAKGNGYLLSEHPFGYSVSDVNMALPTISAERLRFYYRAAHRSFYLRPRLILRRFLNLRTWEQFRQEVTGAMAILGWRPWWSSRSGNAPSKI